MLYRYMHHRVSAVITKTHCKTKQYLQAVDQTHVIRMSGMFDYFDLLFDFPTFAKMMARHILKRGVI